MSGTSVEDFFGRQAQEARGPESELPARRKVRRSRLVKRIALAAAATLVAGIVGVAGGAYLTVNHLASSVHRIPGIVALAAANQPVVPAAFRHSITVLLTSSGLVPDADASTGLIALVHLDADGQGGAVVSIPANALVHIPGHGNMELGTALQFGGPSLLIRTVEQLTNVRIDHYSVLDFAGVRNVVGAMNGVNVDVPYTVMSDGFTFHAGTNHLTSADVLAYARQAGVSEVGRAELEQNLIRAMLDKIAQRRMFSHVATDYRVLRALAGATSVDSDFTNSQLESLALKLGYLRGHDGVFITAPTLGGSAGAVRLNRPITRRLWSAIRNDSVAMFAQRYPFTVTPGAPG